MTYEGVLSKMPTEIGNPIQYYLVFESSFLNINQLLNKEISIQFLGYQCLNCGKKKKIFRQGFCYDCFYSSPAVGDWIMKPELSTAHLGIEDRDLAYEQKVQLQPHIVYLALSSEVKVGVTRKTQMPTRWIDQGAEEAIVVVEVPNRYLAGITEVALKNHFADKTNWRKMLEDDFEDDLDLADFREKIKNYFPENFQNFYRDEHEMIRLDYPYEKPEKINSFTLDKNPEFEGILKGIKGQYLAFDGGNFINVRGHEGYVIDLEVSK